MLHGASNWLMTIKCTHKHTGCAKPGLPQTKPLKFSFEDQSQGNKKHNNKKPITIVTNKSPILGARSAIGPVPTCGIETKAVGGFQSPRPSSKFTIHVARSGWVNRPVSIFQYPRSTNPPPQWSRKKGWQPLTASIRKEWQKTTNKKQQTTTIIWQDLGHSITIRPTKQNLPLAVCTQCAYSISKTNSTPFYDQLLGITNK